jgi:hypothetical protein
VMSRHRVERRIGLQICVGKTRTHWRMVREPGGSGLTRSLILVHFVVFNDYPGF